MCALTLSFININANDGKIYLKIFILEITEIIPTQFQLWFWFSYPELRLKYTIPTIRLLNISLRMVLAQ
jgi:hypothetical protein